MNQIIAEDTIFSCDASNDLYYALLDEHDLYKKKVAEMEALLDKEE